jgi:hypothetical protein
MRSKAVPRRRMARSAAILLGVSLAMSVAARVAGGQTGSATRSVEGGAADPFEGPISFEPNQGQVDQPVRFMARGPGYTLCLTHEAALLSFETGVSPEGAGTQSFAVKLLGANSSPALVPKNELPTKSSYFLGSNPKNWRTGIPNFARVQFQDVYPGIDVSYHGTHGRLEYDFAIAAGATPSRIAMAFSGTGSPLLDAQGNLLLRTGQIEIRFQKPTAYQDLEGARHVVSARYVVRKKQIRFVVGAYDPSKPLVIDPVLSYAVHPKARKASVGRTR